MNTENMVLVEDLDFDIDKLKIPNLNIDEENCLKNHIAITKQIQEIDQLFHVFRYNLKMILDHYKVYHDDRIEYLYSYSKKEIDYIIINTLVINYIGSAKSLIELIEAVLKSISNENLNIYIKFKKEYLTKEYDSKFSYRFLFCMRNFSQHGYLPISIDANNRCFFDFNSILSVSHFTFKKELKDEMLEIKQKIYEKYKGYPKISFTRTIAEFNMEVIKLYQNFLDVIEDSLIESVQKVKKLIKKNPRLVHKSSDCLNNFVLYRLSDGTIHCFSKKDNPIKMINDMKDNVSNILQEESIEYEKIINTWEKNKIKEE